MNRESDNHLQPLRWATGDVRRFVASFAARAEQPELLDLGYGTPDDVARNLAEMARTNRTLGGTRALLRHLLPRLRRADGPTVLLDLGTGRADIPLAIAQWGRRHRRAVRVLALDAAPRHLTIAQTHARGRLGVTFLAADATRLPLPPDSVDYVISSLFLHHFAPAALADLLRAAFATARRGLVMADLVRGWMPYVAFQLLPRPLAGHFLTRHDGSLSIRRAYTPAELRRIALAAGLPQPQVHAHWPWRMTLVVDK